MVLETIEQDNYNRKYGDQKTNKKHRKLKLESSSSEEQVAHTHPTRNRKPNWGRKNYRTVIVTSAINRIAHWSISAQHGDHSVTTARKWEILPRCANPKPSTGYKRIHQRIAAPSHGPRSTPFKPSTA